LAPNSVMPIRAKLPGKASGIVMSKEMPVVIGSLIAGGISSLIAPTNVAPATTEYCIECEP